MRSGVQVPYAPPNIKNTPVHRGFYYSGNRAIRLYQIVELEHCYPVYIFICYTELMTEDATYIVETVDGGWVCYAVPTPGSRLRFSDTKPYYAPQYLDELQGPTEGYISLPHCVHWGSSDRLFCLTRHGSLRQAYQALLEEGTITDLKTYLNAEVLRAIWDDLRIPPRMNALWQNKVIGF